MNNPNNLPIRQPKAEGSLLDQFTPSQRQRLRNAPTLEEQEALIKLFKRYNAMTEEETYEAIHEEMDSIRSTLKGLRRPYPRFSSPAPTRPEMGLQAKDGAVHYGELQQPEKQPMDSAQRKRFITQLESKEVVDESDD